MQTLVTGIRTHRGVESYRFQSPDPPAISEAIVPTLNHHPPFLFCIRQLVFGEQTTERMKESEITPTRVTTLAMKDKTPSGSSCEPPNHASSTHVSD
jgi:hypothetical protein